MPNCPCCRRWEHSLVRYDDIPLCPDCTRQYKRAVSFATERGKKKRVFFPSWKSAADAAVFFTDQFPQYSPMGDFGEVLLVRPEVTPGSLVKSARMGV